MNRLIAAATAAALIAASSLSAHADEATGMITAIDTAAATLTLDTGETFVLPSPVVAASLAIGQEVTVTYQESSDGTLTALEVAPGAM
jgi:hypothetical protein